jgi:hypothetical protein
MKQVYASTDENVSIDEQIWMLWLDLDAHNWVLSKVLKTVLVLYLHEGPFIFVSFQ